MNGATSRPTFRIGWLSLSLLGVVVCYAGSTVRLRGLLFNSGCLAGGAMAIGVPIGVLLAVVISKTSLPGRNMAWRLLITLLFVPLYVQAAAWQAAFGKGGWIAEIDSFGGWWAAVWIHGIASVSWVVLLVGASLKQVPRELEEETLQDVHAASTIWYVSLRQASAGVLAAALWIAVVCFGEITVTDLFQVRTFAEEIYTASSFGTLNSSPVAIDKGFYELATHDLWLGSAIMVCLVSAALAAGWSRVSAANILSSSDRWVGNPQRGRWAMALVIWFALFLLVGVPLIGLLGEAGAKIERDEQRVVQQWSSAKAVQLIVRSSWEHRREFRWSLIIGTIAAALATSIGVLIAWALRTGAVGLWSVAMCLAIGFSIPGPLLGIWTIAWMNHPDDSGLSFLTWCYDSTVLAPVFVQTIRALPMTTLVLIVQMARVPQSVLDSATSDGAGWAAQLASVVLPICWPGIFAAGLLAMVVAVGDMAATLLVAPPGVTTISMRVFSLLHYGTQDRVSALCLVFALGISFVAIGAVERVARLHDSTRLSE